MDNKIEVKNVVKKFESFELGEISFSIPRGYITGIIGRNGAGKTTTIKALLSLLRPDAGEIIVDKKSIENTEYLQNTGIVMEHPFLGKDWNMHLVNKAMKIGYRYWDEKSFFSYLDRFAIKKTLKFKELSRGMKIKLMLSAALSHQANLLIMDEPTSGLDPMMRDEFTDILKEFVEDEKNTVLFSTHITQDLEAIADFIIFMDKGKVVDFCSKDDFIDKYRIVKGGKEDFEKINPKSVLGYKQSMFGFEILTDKKALHMFPKDIDVVIEEKISIEKIMMLFGRGQ